VLDHGTFYVAGSLDLLAGFIVQIAQSETPTWLALLRAGAFGFVAVARAHGFEFDGHTDVLAVPQNTQFDLRAGVLLADFDLQCASVADGLPVDASDYVSDFEPALCAR